MFWRFFKLENCTILIYVSISLLVDKYILTYIFHSNLTFLFVPTLDINGYIPESITYTI